MGVTVKQISHNSLGMTGNLVCNQQGVGSIDDMFCFYILKLLVKVIEFHWSGPDSVPAVLVGPSGGVSGGHLHIC